MKTPGFIKSERVHGDVNPVRLLTFKIDDRDVSAREDETILTVAREETASRYLPSVTLRDCPNVVPAGFALLKSKVFPNCFLHA